MIVSRSIMRTIATSMQVSYRDLRAGVWQQLAAMPRDNCASESVRVLLTAWDESELANLVTADMFSNADRADIAFEFAVLSTLSSRASRRRARGRTTTTRSARGWAFGHLAGRLGVVIYAAEYA
jgi:hypothetical protein